MSKYHTKFKVTIKTINYNTNIKTFTDIPTIMPTISKNKNNTL